MNTDFRRIGLLTCVVFLWVSTCFAQQQPAAVAKQILNEPKSNPGPAPASVWDFMPRSFRVENALKDPTEVNFTDIPLKDALDYLEELHHIQIWIDSKALSDEGISVDNAVTLLMSDVSLRSVLRLLIEPLGLEYVVQREILVITTKTVADQTFENRVYNTTRLPNLPPKDLLEIITKIVEPDQWRKSNLDEAEAAPRVITFANPVEGQNAANEGLRVANDARKGSICAIGGALVVHQTRRVHDQIVELLEQLERQQAAQQAKLAAPRGS